MLVIIAAIIRHEFNYSYQNVNMPRYKSKIFQCVCVILLSDMYKPHSNGSDEVAICELAI